MWAGSILLRIGEQSDVLVAVQADNEQSLDLLRNLFEAWLEPQFPDATQVAKPAFGVRLAPVPDRRRHTPGPKPVPQLRYGSTVIARSRRSADIVRSLTAVLGGVHLQRRDDGLLWIGLRPFVRDRSIVLVDADPPDLVNDRRLADADIHELPSWSVAIEPDGTVTVPPPLPGLVWESVGVEPPTGESRSYELAGIVAHRRDDQAAPGPDRLVAELGRRSHQSRWSTILETLAEAGRLTGARDHVALRDSIRAALGDDPERR